MLTSDIDEKLRYMRIADRDQLMYLESKYAKWIELGPCGRYGCHLMVRGHHIEFRLIDLADGPEFVVTKDGRPLREEEAQQESYKLVRHRAAQVMSGVRAGHHMYNSRRKTKSGA